MTATPPPNFSAEIRRPWDHWLGVRGIYRHALPDVEKSWRQAQADGAPVGDVVSTTFGKEWDGLGDCPASVVGELTRWVDPDGTVRYSAVVSSESESGGFDSVSLDSLDDLCQPAKACAELRYEWASIAIWKDRG